MEPSALLLLLVPVVLPPAATPDPAPTPAPAAVTFDEFTDKLKAAGDDPAKLW